MSNLRRLGEEWEKRTANYLVENGYRIECMNFRCRMGEIDIIARDGGYLVFIEVKYRKKGDSGLPTEAVGYQKQRKISRVADYYLMKNDYTLDEAVRFDVISVLDDDIQVLKNAFEYISS